MYFHAPYTDFLHGAPHPSRRVVVVNIAMATETATRVLLYRYGASIGVQGGTRELLGEIPMNRFDRSSLEPVLRPGHYRLEWRSARNRVVQVVGFCVQARGSSHLSHESVCSSSGSLTSPEKLRRDGQVGATVLRR